MPNVPDRDRMAFNWIAVGNSDAQVGDNPAVRMGHAANAQGAQLLALCKLAGLLDISWQHLAHPGLEETGQRLRKAAARFSLAPGIGLEDWFWTSPQDLWEGKIARQFESYPGPSKTCPPGFLCIFAQDASPRGVFWQKARPLLLRDKLYGNFETGGPYMALLRCEADWTGRVDVIDGYVQPVHSAHVPFPVTCALERTVAAMLLKVAERLDDGGLDMKVSRALGHQGPDDYISICLSRQNHVLRKIALTCADIPNDSHREIYKVTQAKLEDHTFLNWLVGVVLE